MPNVRGGKGYKRGGRGRQNKTINLDVDINDGLHFYAIVLGKVGEKRIDVKLSNGERVQAIIPGKMYKKVWLNKDDMIIVLYESNSCEVISKLTNPELRKKAEQSMVKEDNEHDIFFDCDIQDDDEANFEDSKRRDFDSIEVKIKNLQTTNNENSDEEFDFDKI